MKSKLFVLLLLLVGSLSAQTISNRRIKRQIRKWKAFESAHIAVSVVSMDRNKTKVSFRDHEYMTPASNVKLLTFLAAQQQFDSLPALQYVALNDSTNVFRSTGYPLLYHPLYPDPDLSAFFNQDKKWFYDAPLQTPKRLGSGWSWDDFNYYFSAEISPFPIFGNTVQASQSGQQRSLYPSTFLQKILLDTLSSAFEREENKNIFRYNPRLWKDTDTIYRPFITSDSLFVSLLAHQTQNPVRLLESPYESSIWNTLFTHHEKTLYKGLLQDSDNGIAESLLLMISQQKWGYMDTQKTIDTLLLKWKPWLPDPIEWVDGSGVSRYNMITPRTLTAVLQKIYNTVGWESITTLFPKGGVSGTLKKYKGAAVFAKTGTLRHNHNLSGYLISKKGRTYLFSIMVNHHTASTSEIREGIGNFLFWLEKKLR